MLRVGVAASKIIDQIQSYYRRSDFENRIGIYIYAYMYIYTIFFL